MPIRRPGMKLSSTFAESVTRFVKGLSTRHLALLLVLGTLATPVFAQEGTILGTVTDPTGAAVPNVPITFTKIDTGQARHFTTDSAGQYVSPALPIGDYSVRVEAQGFKPVDQRVTLA